MEELKKRIGLLRAKFNKQGLDVDKLLFILKRDQLLPPDHVSNIEQQATSSAKLDMLLDEIVSANENVYHKLMTAVEQCAPVINVPSVAKSSVSPVPRSFLNQTVKVHSHRSEVPGSESYSLTSDSEDDILRGCATGLTDVHGKELPGGYGKLTNILNPRNHDRSASSSFLVFSDRYSPLTLSDERLTDRHSPLEPVRKHISSDNCFDWVKMQCDGALGELETLKQQNAEKIGQISQKAECFRNMYKKSEAVSQQTRKDLHSAKTLNDQLLAEKQQLEENLEQLKKLREADQVELNELRMQLNKTVSTMSGPGSDPADILTDMYHASLQKYDALRKEYDVLRESFADLAAKHSSACCQLKAMEDLRKQMDEIRRERDTTMRDKIAFQQQCTSVIQSLDQTMNDNRRLKAEYNDLQREHEECGKSQRQFISRLSQLQKECSMALAAKIEAEREHQQILKEREVVHQELQELNDQVSENSKAAEKHNREKIAAENEVEHLKQELAAAILARDKYWQDWQSAHELRGQLEAKLREVQRELQLTERQRDAARKERHQALEQMDVLIKETYEKSQKEKAEEMDQVAKEAEVLKKQIDKIKHELTDAEQEATKATERRDWAFSEIDKTVQERESIRILCDNLRRDRDRAVSELAKALRNSDECEKQKNDAVKELKEIRDKYEAMVERDSRRQQLNSVGHNHSRDSAIDADLQEWETETLEIELDGGEDHDLGFELVGGKDNPQFPGDTALYISHVAKGGVAEGKLRVNDLLLKVNNLDTANIERRRAQQALSNHSRAVTLVVRRRKMSAPRTWQPLQLLISCQKEGSIQLEQGLFVSAVHSGRIIGKDGMLPSFGDQIISINHQSTENLTVQEALDLLEKSLQPVAVGILRQASPLSSTGSSPTPTSVSALSPLTEQLSPTQSAIMSKSDTLATHNSMWDSTSGDSARSGGGSSKNLRSSGSQTDSLDSPGPSPPKSLRNHDHDKGRHSMPVLDKAKEIVVETLFRSRNKSQDHERSAEKQYSKDDSVELRNSKDKSRRRGDGAEETKRPVSVMVPCVTQQTSPKVADDVVVEFPASIFTCTGPNLDGKSRKREYEADSNNGTWPKSRSGILISGNVPSTVTLASAKERPSIQDPLIFQPPFQQQCKNSGEGGGGGFPLEHSEVYHSPQNSSSSSVKYPPSPGLPQPFIPSPKSPPHFSVGVMQSAVRPAFPRQWPGQTPPPSHHHHSHHPKGSQTNPIHSYPHPHPRQQPPHVKPLPIHPGPKAMSPPDLYPATLHPQRVTPKVGGGRSNRPTSAPQRPHNPDRQWPPPPAWPQPLHSPPPHSRHYPPKSLSPDAAATVTTHRPTSLEVPFKFGEEIRVASPVDTSLGSGLPGWVPQSSGHAYPVVSSSSSQHSSRPLVMNPRHSSPPGMFPALSPELEVEHTLFPSSAAGPPMSASCHHSSPSPSQQSFVGVDRLTPTPSEEFNPRFIRPASLGPHGHPLSEVELRHTGAGGYPRHDKHLERIRIPSSNSVTTKSGSVEIFSDRSSPVSSILPFDRSGPGKEQRHSLISNRDDYLYGPRHHETRIITFESSEPVGFQIQGGPAGGIFVSAVSDHSLASKAGLVIGYQLLEVCGINMRNATLEHALTVLRQCRDNIRMKVQFNPEKYMDGEDTQSAVSTLSPVHSSPAHSKLSSEDSEQSTPKHHPPQRSKSCSSGDGYERSHVVPIKRHKGDNGPGFSIVGGNAVGIFIHEIDPSSPAASVLQRGYRILEYNNVSFQALTLEQAFLELNKPCSTMRLNILNRISKYNKVQNIPGDHFFIRTNFSRSVEGEGELDFEKDDILMVENTMHRGALGLWLAWLLDDHGNKLRCGAIPSRLRLEDEMVLKRSHSESWSLGDSDELKGSRRGGSGSARRSFFRRRRPQRTNSKDSREGSFSEVSLTSESVPILDESVFGYTQVERIELEQTRPVVLLAPLADALIRKLVSESPDKYKFCEPCTVRALMKDMEQSVAEGRLVDYWKKEDCFECIQVSHLRSIADEKIHCLLDVNPRAIERLHRLKIYPIVIFVHHKNAKQLREIRDSQFLPEKLSSKASKDSFDHFAKMEEDFSHLFSLVVQGGNLAEMSTHIKTAINSEQKKAVWNTHRIPHWIKN